MGVAIGAQAGKSGRRAGPTSSLSRGVIFSGDRPERDARDQRAAGVRRGFGGIKETTRLSAQESAAGDARGGNREAACCAPCGEAPRSMRARSASGKACSMETSTAQAPGRPDGSGLCVGWLCGDFREACGVTPRIPWVIEGVARDRRRSARARAHQHRLQHLHVLALDAQRGQCHGNDGARGRVLRSGRSV